MQHLFIVGKNVDLAQGFTEIIKENFSWDFLGWNEDFTEKTFKEKKVGIVYMVNEPSDFDFARKGLNKFRGEIPVFFYSKAPTDKEVVAAYNAGIDHFLLKKMSIKHINILLEETIKRS